MSAADEPVRHPPSIGDAPDRAAWNEGFKTGLPTLFGIAAWGMVVGIAMVKSGLSVPQALGMTRTGLDTKARTGCGKHHARQQAGEGGKRKVRRCHGAGGCHGKG